jgi:hypothetical protein
MNARQTILRRLLALFAMLVSCMGCTGTFGQTVAGTGYVDEARFLAEARQLVISGWAAPEKPNVFTTNLIVKLGGHEIYRGRVERSERPDVVESTARADWLWSGFSVRIDLPGVMEAGRLPLAASMRLGDGTEFELEIAPAAHAIAIEARPPSPSAFARLALLVAIGAPLLALSGLPAFGKRAARFSANEVFAATVVLSFALLVGAGWTGSSLGLVLDERGIAVHDERPWIGELRSIRSDEWQVITPLAISQAMHQPRFPRINENLGTDGQNMLVIGMAGVPVAHISTLAKPATWGFFLFDLKRALAWYWWFPFFACFGGVWLLLRRFFELDRRLATGLALATAAAPYSVVFSGWPAYALFFPVAGLLAADAALRARFWLQSLAAGALLGLAVAGFALVLYPAWQISLAYLFLPFAFAWFAGRRNELFFGRLQVAALVVALAVASVLLLSWWLDAREAVGSIRGTVYPGQRSVEVGGDIDRWFLLKGLMGPITMYRDSSLMWGASDAGSIVFFILPALAAVVLRWISLRRVDAVSAVLCAYVVVALFFMFVGFPPGLAKLTLWGSTTTYRFDLALGAAQLLVFAWLAAPGKPGAGGGEAAGNGTALAIAALVAIQAAYLYQLVPPAIIETIPVSFVLLSILALAAGGYLLLRGRHAAFFCVYGTLTLVSSLPFNPLGTAPDAIAPAQALAQAVRPAQGHEASARRGIVVVGERNWAMVLPAAGVPVVNSVFYYPPESLWRRLDPEGKLRVIYNRYQRVLFVLAPQVTGRDYRIDSPRLDEVRVTLDPARFDFRLTGGEAVLAGSADARALSANPTLKLVHTTPAWALFAMLP